MDPANMISDSRAINISTTLQIYQLNASSMFMGVGSHEHYVLLVPSHRLIEREREGGEIKFEPYE